MNATLLFQLWETGTAYPAARADLMHQAARDDRGMSTRSASIGERVHALLGWREQLFGASMPCIGDCPQCNERVEFELKRTDLSPEVTYTVPEELRIKADPFHLRLRVPRVVDVSEAAGDPEELLARCVLEARTKSKPIPAHKLPAAVRDRIEEALRSADPLLDLQLELKCPACSTTWSAPFDVAAYCWNEVVSWGQRMVWTIHQLASAYGWTESEVLGLSAYRRERYLQLIGS